MIQDESHERLIFLGTLILLGIVILLQSWGVFAGLVKPDFLIVFLLVAALFWNWPKLVILILVSVFFINWRPVLGLDIVALGLLPIGAFLVNKFIPGKKEITAFATVLLGTLIFYSISSPSVFWVNTLLTMMIIVWNLGFGALVFYMISKFFNPKR